MTAPFKSQSIETCSTVAGTVVTCEYGEVREGTWKFPTMTGPSRSDIAQQGTFTVVAGELRKGGGLVTQLNDGVVSNNGEDAGRSVFFAHHCREGGKLQVDLGAVQPIRQVNSYSFHTWGEDQGGRTPQVYTLSGSVDGKTWVKIADVDSRPNKTGENWGNRPHGVQITGIEGSFRYLQFAVKPTNSPLTAQRQGGECWSNTFYMEVDVHSAATLAAFEPAKVTSQFPNLEEIVVVFKSHFDIGYTHLASDVIREYRTSMIDRALNAIQAMPPEQQFAWTVPGWPLYQMVNWEKQDPVRRARIQAAIQSGRIAWHGMPYTLETDSLDMETIVRGFLFSDELSRQFGKPLAVAGKMTDVPQHSWFLPTVLSHAGIKFIHIGTNNQCIPPDVPDFFFWEGPDGGRVLVFISKQSYGSGLFPPRDWPHKTWFAMLCAGDNAGPPGSGSVMNVIKSIQTGAPGVKITLGSIDDFYRSISKEDLSSVPVVRGDMPDTWIHGMGSMPAETAIAHNIRPQLATWEMLDTLLVRNRIKPAPAAAEIATAYENSLLFGEHTWGSQTEGIPDDLWGGKLTRAIAEYKKNKAAGIPMPLSKPGIAFFEESFDQHRRYIWKTRDLAEAGLAANMKLLAENVTGNGPRTVVFNPLPWQRDAIIHVDGQPFLAKDVPAGGYKAFSGVRQPPAALPESEERRQGTAALQNAFFQLTLDPARGGITSLVDRKTGRELVEKGAVLGQYLFEQFSADEVFDFIGEYDQNPHPVWKAGRARGVYRGAPITPESILKTGNQMGKPHMPVDARYSASYAAEGTLKVERNRVGHTATIAMHPSGSNPDPVTLVVRLYDDLPYLDIEWEIDSKTPNRIPEGGWLCFPFNLARPSWRLGRLGAVTDPAKDIVANSNVHLFALQSGVSVRGEDGFGVALCPLDSPLVSLGEPGLWKFSRTWTERRARVFVNLFNNMWNTNFPLWIDGSWRSRVRLWPLAATGSDWDMVGPAWEARTACAVAVADGNGGRLPTELHGLSVSRPGVLVTALTPSLLRVWEQAGNSGMLTVTLPGHFKTATPVNLRGEPAGQPVAIHSGQLTFNLPAYAPASYILNP